ncbi:MAG: hypothetical protein BroJett030_31940 [Alphaproteobacteria bacterium]|nr:MAG: hypothetical protein BroJett030_31940 [Alphaproteobacteria bacterium]
MQKTCVRTILAGISVVGVALAPTAALTQEPAAAVEKRQQLMKEMSRSFGPIIAVLKGESDDLDAAGTAAMTMSESMREAMTLFIEGTTAGEVTGSRAKSEIWSNSEEFKAAGDELINASAELAEAAKFGDVDQFKVAFQPLAAACGGCHEGPSRDGGKFRTPAQ